MTKDQDSATKSTSAWGSLSHRRFGDSCERKFDFDNHSILVRSTPPSSTGQQNYQVTTGDYTTTLSVSRVSPTEMISQFPHTRATSTIIPIGSKVHIFASGSGKHYTLTQPLLEEDTTSSSAATDRLTSPMPATVIEVRVKPGDEVKEGQVCAVLESMKMEISIRAGRDGVVGEVNVDKGQTVEEGVVLVALKSVSVD